MKKVKLTKNYLESLGITRCDENGQLWSNDYPIHYFKVWCKHKYGNDKYYWAFVLYDKELYQSEMVRFKAGERKRRPTGIRTILVSRAVYAWIHGETPDGLDICHLNDNQDDNRPEMLVALTHRENIRNKKIKSG